MTAAAAQRATAPLALLLAITVVAIAPGCGSADEEPSPPPREPVSAVALAKPDHLELASRMCADSWQRMQRTFARRFPEIARAYRDEATQAEGEGPDFSRVIRAIFLPGLQRQLDDLRALGAPRNEQRKVALILGEMRQSIDEGWREPIESARDFMNLFAHFSFLAWKYGLNSCLVYESDFRETDA